MYTDTIADYLTRVRNASMAGHKVVDIPSSNIKKDITKILFDQGYILSYKFEDTAKAYFKIENLLNRENIVNRGGGTSENVGYKSPDLSVYLGIKFTN